MQNRIGIGILWALSAVLVAALVDIALGAVLDGSPIRLAAVAAVVCAGAVIAVLRRDPLLVAELSFAILVGLLALGGMRLGTLAAPNGATIGGITADVLGAFVVIVLLLGAFVAAALSRRLPIWLLAVLAAILAYALLPIAFAATRGVGLTAALTTNAPLPSDPFWIRGAFVCAAVLLPAATLACFVYAVVLMVGKKRRAASRLGAGTLIFALATQMTGLQSAQTGLPGTLAFGRGMQLAAAPAASVAGGTAVAFGIPAASDGNSEGVTLAAAPAIVPQDAANRAVDVANKLRDQDYQVDARTDVLGSGIEPAFAFVRDYIRFESYSGMFRGAQGTFTAHAGNAWDRSVLLARMLNRKGIKFRYVTGHLSAADAERLFDRMFEPSTPGGSVRAASQAPAAGDDSFEKRIYARASRDYSAMRTALGGVAASGAALPPHADIIAEIQTHAWLQAQVDGAWIDLDTAFPDAKSGKAYCTVEQTYDDVPPQAMQHVTVRITTESLDNGALSDDTALEVTLPASQLVDKQVFLHNTPADANALSGNKASLIPVLTVAGQDHPGKAIAFAQDTSKIGAMSAGIGGINAGDGTPATSAPVAPSGPQFVAEWLEFEIDTPDGKKDITRRTLIDRAGVAWRAGTVHDAAALRDLPRNHDGIVATETVYNLCFSGGDHNLSSYFSSIALLAGSNGSSPATPVPATDFADQVLPLAIRDFGWFVLSDHVIVPSLNDSPRLRFYADSPRIFVFGFGVAGDGTQTTEISSDLRRDTLRGVGRDASDTAAVLEHKMWFGALEGALEHELGASEVASKASKTSTFTSTSGLLTSQGVTVVRPGSNANLASDPETAARVRAALAAGDTLIVPQEVLRGGAAGWWQIAGASGDTRAVLGADLNAGFEHIGWDTPGTGGYGTDPLAWDITKSNAQNLAARSEAVFGRPIAPVANEDAIVIEVELGWIPALYQFGSVILAIMGLYAMYYAATMTITQPYP
jgi:Transglutaminase-like superfamily